MHVKTLAEVMQTPRIMHIPDQAMTMHVFTFTGMILILFYLIQTCKFISF